MGAVDGRTAVAQPGPSKKDIMAQALDRFGRRIDLVRQSLDIPGMSVAVVHRQSVVYTRGFGLADIGLDIAATENTPYPVASLTKIFASAVIMRLVDEGKIDLDKPMSAYDPGYAQWCASLKQVNHPSAQNYHCDTEQITVRQHLTHTTQGKPGTAYAYNGFLFSRLSAVVDAVSPRGFNRAIEEDILLPLEMRDTALGSGDPNRASVIARMAKPYKLDQDWNLVEPAVVSPPFDNVSAASGIISTVMDLAKYDIAIDSDLVYSPRRKLEVWTQASSPSGRRFPYGLGWFVSGLANDEWQMLWHYGYYPDAFSSLLLKVPHRQLTFILLANTDRASSVFGLGNGDPMRSVFTDIFLDALVRRS
jgi:CubicO group peptidase (beta-lactamase class C family)